MSAARVAAAAVAGAVLLLGPLGVALFLSRRRGLPWALFGAGVLLFILARAAEIPAFEGVEHLFATGALPAIPRENTWLPAILAGLLAAVVHEAARLIVLRFGLSGPRGDPGAGQARPAGEARRFPGFLTGLGLGAGAAGGLAWFTGVILLSGLALAIRFDGATPQEVIEAGFDPAYAVRTVLKVQYYWAKPWWIELLEVPRQLGWLLLSAGLTVWVAQGVRRGGAGRLARYVLFAFLLRAGMEAIDRLWHETWGPGADVWLALSGAALLLYCRAQAKREGAMDHLEAEEEGEEGEEEAGKEPADGKEPAEEEE